MPRSTHSIQRGAARPRRVAHAPHHETSSISTPMPTMMRKPKKSGATGGWSGANASRPFSSPLRLVLEDEARAVGQLDRVVVAALLLVGDREEHQRRAALGVPDRLHRGDLGGLVLERVEPVQVAHDDLHRDRAPRRRRSPARSVFAALASPARLQQPPRRQPRHHERRGEPRGEQHVREAVRERRVEDHLDPVARDHTGRRRARGPWASASRS